MRVLKERKFSNGVVYALETDDGYPVEVTDTFLPAYTKDCVGERTNKLHDYELGSRNDRWMIGVSCMSGCPVRCKFCATGQLPRWRNLTDDEILEQIQFVLNRNLDYDPDDAFEFKINYTRMGEPMLNLANVREAISRIDAMYPMTHHYVSTIGVRDMDTSWVKDNITLQLSLHSLDEARRGELIPYNRKMSIEDLGRVRTDSDLKTTLNMTLVDEQDFDIEALQKHFSPDAFFVKLSPINPNLISEANQLGLGVVESINLE